MREHSVRHTVGAKPSNRKEFGFSRKRGPVVITAESLRVGLAGRALGVGRLHCSGAFRWCGICAQGTSSKITANIAAPYFSRNKDQREDSFWMCAYLACSLLVAKVRMDAIFKKFKEQVG